MPKPKWNLNTIYISERLQESLRPVSRCQLTTVVAPMGYGKTTAVNWYLEERAKTELLRVIRISVYSDNLAIFWKSVQDAFLRAGFDFLGDYVCPSDAAGGGLLIDAICHELEGEASCYIFIDDFHLLTDSRASGFLCKLANRLPGNVHLLVASRDRFLPAAEAIRLGGKVYQIGTEQLRLNHTELAVYAHRCGTELSDEQVNSLLYSSEGWFSAVYLNLRTLSECGALPDRNSDIYTMFTAAMIDPLSEKQREFLAVMGLADEFTVEMAYYVTENEEAERTACRADRTECVCKMPAGRRDLPLSPYDESVRGAYVPDACAGEAAELPGTFRTLVRGQQTISPRDGRLPKERELWRAAAHYPKGCRYSALLAEPAGGDRRHRRMPGIRTESASAGDPGADAQHVQLEADPKDDGDERLADGLDRGTSGAVRAGTRQSAGRMRPHP